MQEDRAIVNWHRKTQRERETGWQSQHAGWPSRHTDGARPNRSVAKPELEPNLPGLHLPCPFPKSLEMGVTESHVPTPHPKRVTSVIGWDQESHLFPGSCFRGWNVAFELLTPNIYPPLPLSRTSQVERENHLPHPILNLTLWLRWEGYKLRSTHAG